MIYGQIDLLNQTKKYRFNNILDIGMGRGEASLFFLKVGKTVYATGGALDFYNPDNELLRKVSFYPDINVEDMSVFKSNFFDAIWMAHVLEHVQNPGIALQEIHRILKPEGFLFIMVPPYKPNLVMGHITTGWNIGTLMYNLLISGFNIKQGSFIYHGYNVAGFVKKADFKLPLLNFNSNDYCLLKDYYPFEFKLQDVIKKRKINWEWYPKNIKIKYFWRKKTYRNLFPIFLKKILKRYIIKQ